MLPMLAVVEWPDVLVITAAIVAIGAALFALSRGGRGT